MGDARCIQYYCWCTQYFKWMDENVLHLKFKSCTSICTVHAFRMSFFFASFRYLCCAVRAFSVLELLLFPALFPFLEGLFVVYWVVRCWHWGPASSFCCSTVEVSFFYQLMVVFSFLVWMYALVLLAHTTCTPEPVAESAWSEVTHLTCSVGVS